jgi:hypothetical protein
VRLGFALESGSRAWGFPSPDSDYDCRFVFIRAARDYLTLVPRCDVIETELTPVLDVSGFDIAKALKLLVTGSAVIIEWLTSPIVYRSLPGFRSELLGLARRLATRESVAQYYFRLAHRVINTRLRNPEDVDFKKLFFALRPALSLRWLRLNPDASVAPMNLAVLCAGADLDQEVEQCIERLLATKSASREMGRGAAPCLITDLIFREIAVAEGTFNRAIPIREEAWRLADDFFRHAVTKYGPA